MAVTIAPIIIYIISLFIPLILTFIGIPFHIRLMQKRGIFGVDIHKEEQPKVAEMGGIVILLSIIITALITIILIKDSDFRLTIGIFCITIAIAGINTITNSLVSSPTTTKNAANTKKK